LSEFAVGNKVSIPVLDIEKSFTYILFSFLQNVAKANSLVVFDKIQSKMGIPGEHWAAFILKLLITHKEMYSIVQTTYKYNC